MSLNQIQESTIYPGKRDWLNSRVDTLSIYDQLNYNSSSALTGDIMELDASLQPTWVPSTSIISASLDFTDFRPNPYTFSSLSDPVINMNPVPILSSPNIVIQNGEIVFLDLGVYMMFLNFNLPITLTTQSAAVRLQRWNGTQFVNDFEGLAVSSVVPQTGNVAVSQTITAIWPVFLTVPHPTNNRFRLVGELTGPTVVTLSETISTLSIVRIS